VEAYDHSKLKDIGEASSKLVGAHDELEDIEESEVAQGCFSLDLGIHGLKVSKIWVRKDYLRIYDNCIKHCEDVRDCDHLSPSAIITGQPGVGKTYWILYAVRRRLGQAEPFVWRYANRWYLFVEGGVFKIKDSDFDPTAYASFMWTFYDSNESPSAFPNDLVAVHSSLFVMFVTSPRRSRWEPLLKNRHHDTFVMNPWTWEEMNKA